MKRKTRALSLILALVLSLSLALPASAAGKGRFTDVPADAWYAEAVNALADGGILAGRGNGVFDPNANVTLAELSVVILRLRGWEDVIADEYHWAGGAMRVCGLGYDMSAPSLSYAYANKPAYRGDAVTALGYMAFVDFENKYLETHPGASSEETLAASEAHTAKYDLRGIADRSSYYALASSVINEGGNNVSHNYWEKGHNICAESIDQAYQFGVLTGIDKNHTCNATGTLTRAELAQMCYNMGWTTSGCIEYE